MSAKPPPARGWKTGEQLEFLLSRERAHKAAQNAKTTSRFWKWVCDEWQSRWPVTPSAAQCAQFGSPSVASLMLRAEKEKQIKAWFNNRGRGSDSGKAGRGDLKLDCADKRMLAAVQAYCSYSWNLLQPIVITRWEAQKRSETFDDEDDPPTDETGGQRPGGWIPLSFKLEIAKELYAKLSKGEKDLIDQRRKEDKEKWHRKIIDIDDDDERAEKLRAHESNQPLVPKSLVRVLSNLEDKTGSVSCLLVASVDPGDGELKIQKFSQGQTERGVDFETFYGEGWAENVEAKFTEWGRRVFGNKDSDRRGKFTLPKGGAASSHGATPESSLQETAPQPSSTRASTPKASSSATGKSASQSAPRRPKPKPSARSRTSSESTHAAQVTSVSGSSPILPAPGAGTPHPSADQLALLATAYGVRQILSQASVASGNDPASPASIPWSSNVTESTPLFVNPSQLSNSSQATTEPSQLLSTTSQASPEVAIGQPDHLVTSTPPSISTSTTNTTSTNLEPKISYRARGLVTTASRATSRRDSLDGAPEVGINLDPAPQLPLHQDPTDDSEVSVDLRDYITGSDEETDISSEQSSDGFNGHLSPPPSSQWRHRMSNQAQPTSSRTYPQLSVDRDNIGPWLQVNSRWEYISLTAGGPAWEELLGLYLKQERKLEWEEKGATLPNKDRPVKISEYFQHAHKPSRGDTLTIPDFGIEVTKWWQRIQPEWRRAQEDPPQGSTTWSYILSGGPKGTFLVILCLAWWDRAYGRYLDKEKGARQVMAEAAGVAADFDDLPDHDPEWLKIVDDVAFVMKKAQACDTPTRGASNPGRGAKRKRETKPPTPRKKPSTTPSRRRKA